MKNLNDDFKEFLSETKEPSAIASKKILSKIEKELNPNPFMVFTKLMGIHTVVAILTLSICPQFGFRIFGQGMGLMHLFMNFGQHGCTMACGLFFTSSSLLLAALILKPDDFRAIRQNRFLEAGALTLLSLGFFFMIDSEIIISNAIIWFIGAMLGSIMSIELGFKLRFTEI